MRSVAKISDAWKRANLGVKSVSAAEYTVEFDEFVERVKKAGKAKIGGQVVENPSDEQLLQGRLPNAR